VTADVRHSLLVDLYELTMVSAYWRAEMAEHPATFSLFVRKLPPARGYLVAAGLDDALRWLEQLAFGDQELEALRRLGRFEDDFLDWLASLRFTGSVRAVPEGTIVFPDEPILEVSGPMAESQLAETFLLNQITLQTVLATKAARCRHAAAGRSLVDFALRRSQGVDAGMKLVRVGRLVGLSATSNVAGADSYGLPAAGTMAHSFVQAHPDECDAFRLFARVAGDDTVLLVDTYDTHIGVKRAIEVALEMRDRGVSIRGIRLDSGDLGALAHDARGLLDAAGLADVKILVSGGLDEHEIHRLLVEEEAPIDGFGLGSSLGVSDDAPTLDSVYKLVQYDGRPVRKTSEGKATWPGAKQVWRSDDWSGDVLAMADEAAPTEGHLLLMSEVRAAGRRTAEGNRSLEECNEHFERQWEGLPDRLKDLEEPGEYPVTPSSRLAELTHEIDKRLWRRHDE
jgi:nicotinate phosphoribosyltransferase